MTKWLKASVPAAFIMVLWGILSWTVLPFNMSSVRSFSHPVAVENFILDQAPVSGIYMTPSMDAPLKPNRPVIFATIQRSGPVHSMLTGLGYSFVVYTMLSVLMCFLLSKTHLHTFKPRVQFVTLVGTLCGVMAAFPNWNWMGFDAFYSLFLCLNTVVMWFLGGLVLCSIYKHA